ncbi:MAG: ATP-binding cassette domain-containing protein [Candidatus Limnocylindrales bacterium]
MALACVAMEAIETRGLTKDYGARRRALRSSRAAAPPALADLDIAVHAGEIFGFLGPNGAGKSTTIRLLLGFLHPTAGGATVLGRDIGHDSVGIRREIGYLPGGIAFWDGLTGERVLDELAALSGRPSVLRATLLDRLELSAATLRRPVRDYSRGCVRRWASSRPSSTTRSWPSWTSRRRDSIRSCSAPSTRSSMSDGRLGGRSSSLPTSCPRWNGSATG